MPKDGRVTVRLVRVLRVTPWWRVSFRTVLQRRNVTMKIRFALAVALIVSSAAAFSAQEQKNVPKDSVRVNIPGCTKGYIFTAAPRTEENPGSLDVPPGTHFRMNGPKKLINDIKAHEGSMVVLTGIIKKGQYLSGGGLRVGGATIGPGPTGGGIPDPGANQNFIDVEGWRQIGGDCPR